MYFIQTNLSLTFAKIIIGSELLLIEEGAPYRKGKVVKEFKKEMKNQNRLFVYGLPS